MAIGWLLGEKHKFKWLDYTQLRHAIICSGFLFVLSCIIACCISDSYCIRLYYSYNDWNCILIASIILMYFNFIVFIIKIWSRGRKIITTIDIKCNEFNKRSVKIRENIDDLLRVKKLSDELDLGFTEDNKPV